MAKMRVVPEDRPRVKLECLRLLATLRLNPAKMHLIAGFVATYLKLDAAGQRVFELEVESMPPSERETYFAFDTPGVRRGKADVLLRQLARRFGPPPEGAREQLECRDVDQLNQLAD